VPTVTCPHCLGHITLPDPPTAPSYTCPHCGGALTMARAAAPPPAVTQPRRVLTEHRDLTPRPGPFHAAFMTMFGAQLGRYAAGCFIALITIGLIVGVVILAASSRTPRPTAPNNEPAPIAPKVPPSEAPPRKPDPAQPDPRPAPSTADPIALAPPPRVALPNSPPLGFTTDWQRLGSIETRVAGVRLGPVVGTGSATGLTVWVETRNTGTRGRTLRRWLGLEPVAFLSAGGQPVPPVLSPAASAPGQLSGSHILSPGGAAVLDVLAFATPAATAENLTLKLSGTHVGESGTFTHTIPASAWK
jgi:hypothetical protein